MLALIMIGLCACTNEVEHTNEGEHTNNNTADVTQGTVSPYKMTDKEINLLQSLGLENYGLVTFHAPEGAVSLYFDLYQLNENNHWEKKSSGGILPGLPKDDTDTNFEGIFSVVRQIDYSYEFYINSLGIGGYRATPLETAPTNLAYFTSFLSEEETITLNEEIPVALMVYDSENSFYSPDHNLENYFNPEKLADKDIVFAVVLTFYDHEVDS